MAAHVVCRDLAHWNQPWAVMWIAVPEWSGRSPATCHVSSMVVRSSGERSWSPGRVPSPAQAPHLLLRRRTSTIQPRTSAKVPMMRSRIWHGPRGRSPAAQSSVLAAATGGGSLSARRRPHRRSRRQLQVLPGEIWSNRRHGSARADSGRLVLSRWAHSEVPDSASHVAVSGPGGGEQG